MNRTLKSIASKALIASVSLIVRKDRLLLVVYNRRYKGWTMPGGRVEPRESVRQAQERELSEETGLATKTAELVYVAPLGKTLLPVKHRDRASLVHVFRVAPRGGGEAREVEKGSPVNWVTRDEFLLSCPFAEFYRRMFAAGVDDSPTY